MPETAVVTLLFTDIVGSTELGQRLGDQQAEELRRAHVEALRGPIASHGGEEVKNLGDGLMVAFPSPSQAVACAVAMQQAVERSNRREEHEIGLRVGLNLGEVTKDEGDYFGTAVVVAERLCKAAQGGQVLTTDAVRILLGSRGGHELKPLGEVGLKGIDEAVAAFEVLWEPGAEPIPLPAALSRETLGGFVARDDELKRLRECWTRAQAGERQLVLLAGEPGIGKTRLSSEFARSVHADGATVLFGRCDEETPIPYQPWVEALGQYVMEAPADELREHVVDRGDLARLVPELASRVPGLATPEPAEPETERYRLFAAVSGFLADVSRQSPLVLVLDDLHWADRPSLMLLRHLVRAHEPAAVLVCGTYRETELARTHPLADVLAGLRREHPFERIHLAGLNSEEIEDWLAQVSGHDVGRRGHRLAEALHEATEGNPFFVQQAVVHLVETGRLFQREGFWTFDERVEQLGIPEGVKEVIGRRLSRLPEECNTALAHASVLGREFEFDVLARMVNMHEDAVLAAIDQALATLLIVDTGAGGAPRYSFTHALVRETLYEELSVPRKQRLHLRAGEAIEAVHHGEVEQHLAELAVHYRTAGTSAPGDKAVDYSVRAGEGARRVFAYEDAALHWLAALELMEDDEASSERRARLLERVGDLMYVTGIDYGKGIDCLESALRIYEEQGQHERAAQVHSRLGRDLSTFPLTMDIPSALEHFRAAEGVLSRTAEGAPLGYVYVGLAAASLWGLESAEGLEASARAMEIGKRLGNDALWSEGASLRAWALAVFARYTEARSLIEEAWEVADRLDHPYAAFLAAWIGCFIEMSRWDVAGVVDWTDRELGKPRQAQARVQREQLLSQLRGARLALGEVAEARRIESEEGRTSPYLAGCEGEWSQAAAIDMALLEASRHAGNRFVEGGYAYYLAQHHTFLGELTQAESFARQGLAVVAGKNLTNELWLSAWLARVCALDGRPQDAAPVLERCREIIAVHDDWAGVVGFVGASEAMVRAAMGRAADADARFEAASEALRRYPMGWEEGEILYQWGRVLGERGDRDGAIAKFDAAIDFFRRKDFGQPWVDRVMAERSRLG